MEKGTKIIDIRDGNQYVVESVDHYDDVTLIFTEDSKYIPIQYINDCKVERFDINMLSMGIISENVNTMITIKGGKMLENVKPCTHKVMSADEFLKEWVNK